MSNVVQMSQPQSDRFEEFWKEYPYPRRIGKMLCKAKWDAITGEGLRTRTFDRDASHYVEIYLQATPDEIIDGVKRYAANNLQGGSGYKFKDDGKFLCQPATWLNQGRWQD